MVPSYLAIRKEYVIDGCVAVAFAVERPAPHRQDCGIAVGHTLVKTQKAEPTARYNCRKLAEVFRKLLAASLFRTSRRFCMAH